MSPLCWFSTKRWHFCINQSPDRFDLASEQTDFWPNGVLVKLHLVLHGLQPSSWAAGCRHAQINLHWAVILPAALLQSGAGLCLLVCRYLADEASWFCPAEGAELPCLILCEPDAKFKSLAWMLLRVHEYFAQCKDFILTHFVLPHCILFVFVYVWVRWRFLKVCKLNLEKYLISFQSEKFNFVHKQ